MITRYWCALGVLVFHLSLTPSPAQTGEVSASGLILPRDGNGIYLRNSEGQVEVEWVDQTRVALEVNTRQLQNLKMADRKPAGDDPVEDARAALTDLERGTLNRQHRLTVEANEVIRNFLAAKTYHERLKFVRNPKQVAPLMASYYKANPDRAIKHRELSDEPRLRVHKNVLLARIELEDFRTMPLVLERTAGGEFLVDWESFVGYCEIPWDQIVERRSTKPFLLRARAKVGDYFNYGFDDEEWLCVKLEDQQREHVIYGYFKSDDVVLKEDLASTLAAEEGGYVTLEVAYPEGGKGKKQLLITDFVTAGWVVTNSEPQPNAGGGLFRYRVHSSSEVIDFKLPAGSITGVVKVRGGKDLETALAEAREEKWIAERGLELWFGEAREGQLPTEADPRFVGRWDPGTRPRTLAIGGEKYEISLKKGGQSSALLFNVLEVGSCKPFTNRATVIGKKRGDVIVADEIRITPVGDQAALDDPDLPRYLFIGDSISGNYGQGLRAALKGKFNLHHPPTNCGPVSKGRAEIVEWLGAYEKMGRHWDVISFNFGHWDAGNDRASYRRDLEAVIAELKKTGAKLIWVTTCPVPKGMPPAGELTADGKAPGRSSGVMEKYLNPWAAEVIAGHPEISTCDQWKFVKENEGGLYDEWWGGTNVHFRGEAAAALGRVLAAEVVSALAK